MKNDRSDKRWMILILLLLAVEIVWFSVDNQWIKLSFLKNKTSLTESKEAGYVLKAQENLKRRGFDSLIWDSAKEKDLLYYRDSILTLSQSTAKLYLKDQIEVQLSENTLVTLEEPVDLTKSEIRLRFSKGDIKARNPNNKTTILTDDWIVNIEKNSEISLRKDKDSYEFEVLKGKAEVQIDKEVKQLDESQILTLEKNKDAIVTKKTTSLEWVDKKLLRIYSFANEEKVHLAWQGSALRIKIQKTGEAELNKEVTEDQQTSDLLLSPGSYQVRLVGEMGQSAAREIEIWNAPRILLQRPLPRDRLPAGQPIDFVWTYSKLVKSYQIKLKGMNQFEKNETTYENFKSLQFDKEEDLSWEVVGFDEDGYLIPALDNYPVFIRQKPLQAPKLKIPTIIIDKDEIENKGSSKFKFWFKFFLPEAIAKPENKYEVFFSWDSVVGADIYTLEVSETSNFKNPELVKNIKANNYTWKNAKFKQYYWRVASGNTNGLKGLFSEAEKLNLEELKKIPKEVSALKQLSKPQPATKAPEPIPAVNVAELKDSAPLANSLQPAMWNVAWIPSYKIFQGKNENNSKINLTGAVPFGFSLNYATRNYDEYYYILSLLYSEQIWKPTPVENYPLQSNLVIREKWFFAERAKINKNFRIGLSVHQSYFLLNLSEETIAIKEIYNVGLRLSWLNESSNKDIKTVYGVSLNASSQMKEINLEFETKYFLSNNEQKTQFYLGATGNLLFQEQKNRNASQGSLGFIFGCHIF